MQPIKIPATTLESYLSFNRALNLRLPGELTGDWHFKVAFFCDEDGPRRTASLAGQGGIVDTNPSLGTLGVRDMAQILANNGVLPFAGPIYVANHFRAIADLAMLELEKGNVPMVVTPETINQWLDEEDQVEQLVQEYLGPLGNQMRLSSQEAFEAWLPTIKYI